MSAKDRDEPVADVEIGAAVRADKLRFKKKPRTKVEYPARAKGRLAEGVQGESDSQTERENLPEEVEPGVTYRDVRVSWVGGARLVADPPQEGDQSS